MVLHSYLVYRLGDDDRVCGSRNPRPTDSFRFNVSAVYRSTNGERFSVDIPTIVCKSFFSQGGYDFLKTHLSSFPYFTSELLDEIIPEITSQVEELFDNGPVFENPYSNVEPHVFRLYLHILFDMWEHHDESESESDSEVMEESTDQFRMIPASKDAVESLKTGEEVTKDTTTRCCAICMEEFHLNDDEAEGMPRLSAMPCNHVFHQRCILRWLQTSHMCPLCRYTMPTVTNIGKI